jgi:hypothetical protein
MRAVAYQREAIDSFFLHLGQNTIECGGPRTTIYDQTEQRVLTAFLPAQKLSVAEKR